MEGTDESTQQWDLPFKNRTFNKIGRGKLTRKRVSEERITLFIDETGMNASYNALCLSRLCYENTTTPTIAFNLLHSFFRFYCIVSRYSLLSILFLPFFLFYCIHSVQFSFSFFPFCLSPFLHSFCSIISLIFPFCLLALCFLYLYPFLAFPALVYLPFSTIAFPFLHSFSHTQSS